VSTSFEAFSWTHLWVLALIVFFTVVVSVLGRRDAASKRPTPLEVTIGLANLFVWVMAHVYWMLPPQFEARTSLPLQLCHLAALAATGVLLSERRVFQTLIYYWGLGLSTQALITPSLAEGPGILWFWVFWQQHGIVPAIAVYALAARGYRPKWRDFRVACVATFGYLCVVLPVDLSFGLNYGFVGRSEPDHPTIIDLLGPWPPRLVVIVAIVTLMFALLTLPWTLLTRRYNTACPPSSS
jgi:hypothetical integral membrane protein (TIGR02206 family)